MCPMLQYEFNPGGFLQSFANGGEDIIKPWGVESADPKVFFTNSERMFGPTRAFDKQIQIYREGVQGQYLIKSRFAEYRIEIAETVQGNIVKRRHRLISLGHSLIGDFVSRFRFRSCHFSTALLAQNRLSHRNSKLNHQFETSEVELGGPHLKASIAVKAFSGAGSFAQFIYAKDAGDEWIVHLRLLPKKWDHEYVKICKQWFNTQPLPYWFGRLLFQIPGFRRRFWYGGEKKIPKGFWMLFNFTIFPYAVLNPGDLLEIESETVFACCR